MKMKKKTDEEEAEDGTTIINRECNNFTFVVNEMQVRIIGKKGLR